MSHTATSPAASAPPIPQLKRTLVATGAGNAVEWYDWTIYATFSVYLAAQLFSHEDPTSAFLQTLAIFAVGFVARPVGGWIFGVMGDRVGRKRAMLMSVVAASVGSLLIGIAPTYDQVGAFASVILVAARLLQGLAHGGELPTAQTYLAEVAPKEKRGFFSSLIYVSGTMGIVVGTLLGALLVTLLSKAQMNDFGWRIPFIIGGLLGLVTILLRSRMHESEVFEEAKSARAGAVAPANPTRDALQKHWKQGLQIIGITVGLTVSYYVWSVAMPSYAIKVLRISPQTALWAGVVGNIAMIVALPLWGKLSDRIGRRGVLLISCLGSAVAFFPMVALVRTGNGLLMTLGLAVMLIFIAASAAIVPAVYAELLPTNVRTVGVAIPYAICVALFGGTAAYLQAGFAVWFGSAGPTAFNIYAIVLLLISAVVAWRMPETKGKDLRG